MNQVPEAFNGQIGRIGYQVAGMFAMAKMGGRTCKVVMEEPYQICCRVEKATAESFYELCEKKGVKPITFAGMILEAAFLEVIEYEESFEIARNEADEAFQKAEAEKLKKPKKPSRKNLKAEIEALEAD